MRIISLNDCSADKFKHLPGQNQVLCVHEGRGKAEVSVESSRCTPLTVDIKRDLYL